MFHCREFPSQAYDSVTGAFVNDTRLLLTSDMRVECTSPSAIGWIVALGIPMLVVFTIGIPATLLWLLYKQVGKPVRQSMARDRHTHEAQSLSVVHHLSQLPFSVRYTLGFLYSTCTLPCRGNAAVDNRWQITECPP